MTGVDVFGLKDLSYYRGDSIIDEGHSLRVAFLERLQASVPFENIVIGC